MKQVKMANNLHILILAAGKGTRMNSDTPKVMHTLGGAPMIDHVIAKAKLLKPFQILITQGRTKKLRLILLKNDTRKFDYSCYSFWWIG